MGSADSRDWLVLGGDVGGTSTRVLVAATDGSPLARGTAGGGNPVSHPDTGVASLAEALAAALRDVDPARIRAAVVGMAGGSALSRSDLRDAFGMVWADAGVGCPVSYVSDLEVAFAAGTAEPDGTVLVAGTGAVAGALRGRRVVGTADGHGWLLGDDGSGFWLGRQAARATLRVLDAAEPPGVLAASVLHALAPSDGAAPPSDPVAGRELVVGTVNGRPPIRLAELAPLVTAACAAGDPVAVRIVEEAAGLLARTLGRVRRDDEDTPLVLAGGLARPGTPVGEALRELVSARFQGPLLTAQDGAGGAAWLALAGTAPDLATDAARERLIAASSPPPRRG